MPGGMTSDLRTAHLRQPDDLATSHPATSTERTTTVSINYPPHTGSWPWDWNPMNGPQPSGPIDESEAAQLARDELIAAFLARNGDRFPQHGPGFVPQNWRADGPTPVPSMFNRT
jgi:hypothetical protein